MSCQFRVSEMAGSHRLLHSQCSSTFSLSARNHNFCALNPSEFRGRRSDRVGIVLRGPPSVKCCSSAKEEEPLVLRAAVSGVTELLRAFSKDSSSQSPPAAVTGSAIVTDDLVEALRSDFAQSYFITGEFTDALYNENCFFADPTVQFSGRDLYKRNLKLLIPFYEDPSLVLDGIKEVVEGESKFIQAYWRLRVYLKLPWKPFIAVDGSTKYDLDVNAQIVKHVESWDITGMEAIGQLFKPSERAVWKRPKSTASR